MTGDEIDDMLEAARLDRERYAVPVEGSIRRTHVGGDEDFLVTCVWDDEFFTTLRVLDYEPRPQLIRDLFLARKASARPTGGRDT